MRCHRHRAFNAACPLRPALHEKEWEEYVARQARWVDFEHDYKTLDMSYTESVIWAFKQLTTGLAYQTAFCPTAGTTARL